MSNTPSVYITNTPSSQITNTPSSQITKTTNTPTVYITSSTSAPASAHAIDTTSLMGVLNNYLVKSPLLTNPDGDYSNVVSQIDTINTGLSGLNNALSVDVAGNILSQQDNVNKIVNTEMNRLNQKEQTIDSALTTQKRMLVMNDGYVKRQKVYIRIMVAIVVGLVFLLMCKFLSSYLGEDENTDVLISMVSILVIVAVVIYCGWSYVMMLRRDPIYFDQIHYVPENKPISLTGNNQLQMGQQISSQITNSQNQCIGPACCTSVNKTKWDASFNTCVVESFGQRATRVETPKGSLSEGLQQLTQQVASLPNEFGSRKDSMYIDSMTKIKPFEDNEINYYSNI